MFVQIGIACGGGEVVLVVGDCVDPVFVFLGLVGEHFVRAKVGDGRV